MKRKYLPLLLLLTGSVPKSYPDITVKVAFAPSRWGSGGDVWAVTTAGQWCKGNTRTRPGYVFPISAAPADLFLDKGFGDTLYIGSVAATDTVIQLHFPLKLQKNAFGHYVCPKCRKADKTVEIVNSLAPQSRMIVTNGDTAYSPIIGRKLYEGCRNQGGRGYCKRDRIKF
jgi:hypothetical protein